MTRVFSGGKRYITIMEVVELWHPVSMESIAPFYSGTLNYFGHRPWSKTNSVGDQLKRLGPCCASCAMVDSPTRRSVTEYYYSSISSIIIQIPLFLPKSPGRRVPNTHRREEQQKTDVAQSSSLRSEMLFCYQGVRGVLFIGTHTSCQ